MRHRTGRRDRTPRSAVLILALAAAARMLPSGLYAQEPLPEPTKLELRAGREQLSAELADRLSRPGPVATAGLTWACSRSTCVAERVATPAPSVELCAQLRARVGPLTAFRRGTSALTPSELRRCNEYRLERAAGVPIVGDGPSGRRPPPREPAPRLPAYRAELRISDVKARTSGPVVVGAAWPVDVLVENTGDAAAAVALQVIELAGGPGRFTYTDVISIAPRRTASWHVELRTTGSGPAGRALCGETTETRIVIVQSARPQPLAGYRPGNSDEGGWVLFHDGNDADNARTVRFRFDCTVVVGLEP